MVTQMEKEDAFNPTNPTPTLNLQKENAQAHRIHRSLSDSKSYSGHLLQPEDESTSRQKAQKAFLSLRRGGSRCKKRHEVRSASGSIAVGEPAQNTATPTPSSTISSTIQWQLGSELHHTRLGGSCSEAYSESSRPALSGTVNNRYSAASSSYTTTTNNSMMSLSPSPSMVSTVSCPEYPELQEKLHKLAMARDTLSMQVTVLNDQVGLQKEKIRDLEALLESKRNTYPYEMLSEQSIIAHENNKSHLMNEICDLKNKFSFLEKEKSDAERRLTLSHNEIERLSQSMINMQMAAAAPHSPSNFPMPVNAAPPPPRILNNPNANGSNMEMEKLRETVQKLIADNAQKNMEISSLRNALDEQARSVRDFDSFTSAGYESNSQRSSVGAGPAPLLNVAQQQPTMDINAQLRKLLIEDMKENIAHSSSYPTSLCNSVSSHQLPPHQPPPELGKNSHLVGTARGYYGIGMQPSNSYTSALSSADSLPPIWNNGSSRGYPPNLYHANQPVFASGAPTMMPTLPPTFNIANVSSYRSPSSPAARQLAAELDELRRVEGNFLAPNQQQQPLYGSSSLPRTLHAKSNSAVSIPRQKHSAGGTATTSGVESDDELARGRQSSATTTNGKFKRGRTRSTIRNFLGKLARSSSQEIRNVPNGHSSGGIRTSVSARLNSIGSLVSGPICIRPPVQHFVDWNCEQVCEWMAEAGFNQYVPEVERFVRSGRHLLNMSNQEFEKELLIKNQLHKKRLRCLLNCIERNTGNVVEPADRMDIHQIMLWLDDIGLPQYRDVFAENLIDGQMLLCLTAQDLVEMKIVSAMNHATIARGLQFLQSVDFCAYRLEKRFNPELMKRCPIPNEVERWAHSCVVQWLKSIDLSEFTPNLMFSGLHGALMIHEPTFSAESLAELLQIPPHKTLLRRHLTSHYNTCLGQEIISRKRDLLRKGFSLSKKKSKQDVFVDPDVPVCPSSTSLIQNQVIESLVDSSEMTDI